MSRLVEAFRVVFAVARGVREHEVEYPAASLAYYGFISLFPLLVLVLAVLSQPAAEAVRTATPSFLTPSTRQLVYEATANQTGRTGAILLSGAVLLWSGAHLTFGFRAVVERAEGSVGGSLPAIARDAVCVVGSLGLAVVSIGLASAFFSTFLAPSEIVGVGLFAVLTVVFLPLYYVPSRLVTSLRAAVPGAVLAAAGWTALLGVAHVYSVNADQYAVFGAISGIIIVLTSVYTGAMLLFVGVILNATLASRRRSAA
ncbi:YihY/virulence factor BrkB family protein [Halogeometricum sp. S1BR25-6]|uniref:YihY/virulence factor BrkB family protein n=1 Tax=Halogeometricum salsisoli TaxID=2950536 RepID=A0ABU2G926_9EURY|nr:YhjD/YihY/BrkB family envelope integrity protein [Halogeometricum sp. S1BR25-6]MDS0297316.1 YihY/virulence factor BrkB family protein [Halogeometricum sp. S1BR25-6]